MVNVTLKDIAQKLSISEATVSLALNNYPSVTIALFFVHVQSG